MSDDQIDRGPHVTDLSESIAVHVEGEFLRDLLRACEPDSGEDPCHAIYALECAAQLIRMRVYIERQGDNWLGSGYHIRDMSDDEVVIQALSQWEADVEGE